MGSLLGERSGNLLPVRLKSETSKHMSNTTGTTENENI